ncbi:MAG: alpha/beta hydrolase [Dehalococcoidia bacterium]
MPTTKAGRQTIFYEREGRGQPLIFIAGLGADHHFWGPLVEQLSGRYDCIVFDNRGNGQSSKPRRGYAPSDIAADTLGLMDSLGIERAHLFGWSLGGMVAQHIALEQPERIRGMVLAGSMAKADARMMHILRSRKLMQRRMEPEEYFTVLASFMYGTKKLAEPGFVKGYVRRAANNPHPQALHAFDQLVDGIGAFDSRRQLRRIKTPTLVMVGEEDILTTPERSRELAAGIPDAELEIVPGVSHFCGNEDPKRVATLTRRFLARVDRDLKATTAKPARRAR